MMKGRVLLVFSGLLAIHTVAAGGEFDTDDRPQSEAEAREFDTSEPRESESEARE